MSLSATQQQFTVCIARLILWTDEHGWKLTFGEAHRPPELAALYAEQGRGIAESVHCHRLAVDFNLFVGGVFQTTTEAHRPLGEYWRTLHPLARWGGQWGDGNHYGFEWEGRK